MSSVVREARLSNAMRQLAALTDRMAFEQISVLSTDNLRCWTFYFGGQHLVTYWPASSKSFVNSRHVSIVCCSAASAASMALREKYLLLGHIRNMLAGRQEE